MAPISILSTASVLAAAAAAYLALNFQSCISGIDFRPVLIDLGPAASANLDAADPQGRLRHAEILFSGEIYGPESIAFDPRGGGPYTGLADGSIVRRCGDTWERVAVTSPRRNDSFCDFKSPPSLPMESPSTESICGRPLGLRFNALTGELYVADAYFGIFLVSNISQAKDMCVADFSKTGARFLDSTGGTVVKRVTTAVPLTFANDVDVDPISANESVLYFTDATQKYQRKAFMFATLEGTPDGGLLRHNTLTGQTEVLQDGLVFANGVALSKDRTFVAFCESTVMRCSKLWIKGPKVGQLETLAHLPGFPDNIRLNPRGRFWVAIHKRRNALIEALAQRPWLRALLLQLLPDINWVHLFSLKKHYAMALELDEDGKITDVLEDPWGERVRAVSQITEHGGKLWFGSVMTLYVATVNYTVQDS